REGQLMAANKVLEAGTPLQVLMPAGVTLTSGQCVLFGKIAGVCNFTNPDPVYPNPSAQMSLDCSGGFNLTCSAVTSISPSVGSAIARGDDLYADGGTKDATSGITYGFTI